MAEYQRYTRRKLLFIVACIVAMVLVIGYAATIGSSNISFMEVYETIFNHFFNQHLDLPHLD